MQNHVNVQRPNWAHSLSFAPTGGQREFRLGQYQRDILLLKRLLFYIFALVTVPRKFGIPLVFFGVFCFGIPSALNLDILVNQVSENFSQRFQFLKLQNSLVWLKRRQQSFISTSALRAACTKSHLLVVLPLRSHDQSHANATEMN